MLIRSATQETLKNGRKVVKYEDLVAAIRKDDTLEFLQDVIPPKEPNEKAQSESSQLQNPANDNNENQSKLPFQPTKKQRREWRRAD